MENNLNFLVVFKNQPPKKRPDGYFLASAGSRYPAGTRRVPGRPTSDLTCRHPTGTRDPAGDLDPAGAGCRRTSAGARKYPSGLYLGGWFLNTTRKFKLFSRTFFA